MQTTQALNECELTELPADFAICFPQLEHLDLSQNKFEAVAVNAFLSKFSDRAADGVVQLKALYLGHNNLTDFPEGAAHHKLSLHVLSLCHNSILTLPRVIGNMKSLRVLDLSYNTLRGELPLELSHCEHLTSIDLSHRPTFLGGADLQHLPHELGLLKSLRYVGVRGLDRCLKWPPPGRGKTWFLTLNKTNTGRVLFCLVL